MQARHHLWHQRTTADAQTQQYRPRARICQGAGCRVLALPCNQRSSIITAAASAPGSHEQHTVRQQNQAVVVGSGMAGLAAAEVLSKHFSKVVVLERDTPQPEWEQSAIDMMQYDLLHGMTAGGLLALDKVFGGRYSPALQAAGANLINLFTQTWLVHPRYGRWMPNPSAQPASIVFCTRHLFETTARRLVTTNERVQFMYGVVVQGLIYGAAAGPNSTVSGVHLKDGRTLPAALVVDASGRHSAAPDWLAAAGYDKPRVSTASANCGYASRLVQLSPEAEASLGDIKAVYFMAHAPECSLGILVRSEGGYWMVSTGGYLGKRPPMKDEQFFAWAQQEMYSPEFSRLLRGCTPVSHVSRFYGLGSTWRHYEESAVARQLPEGLLLLGDSICSFQPVYGQGMTVAAQQVEVLDRLLSQRPGSDSNSSGAGGLPAAGAAAAASASSSQQQQLQLAGLSAEFQAAVLPLVRASWDLAVGSDMKYAGAVSSEAAATGLPAKLKQELQEAIFELATYDEVVSERLLRYTHMLDPPEALLQPAVLGRVALHWITTPFRAAAAAAAARPAAPREAPVSTAHTTSSVPPVQSKAAQ